MNLGVLLVVYIITMAELVWLLKCTNIGIKNLHFAGYGLALLVVIGLIFGSKIGSGGEGPLGMRSAFFITILMVDRDTVLSKIENAMLVELMKDCVLLAVETWFVKGIWLNVGKEFLPTFMCFFVEFVIVIIFGFVLKFFIATLNGEQRIRLGRTLDYIIVVGCFVIFMCIYVVYKLIQNSFLENISVKCIACLASIALLLLEVNILYKKWLTERVQQYAKAEHELYETQKNYYMSLLDKEADTKKYRHDMNNHMICIKSLLEEGNYKNLQKYIDNLYDYTNFLVNKAHKTGNSIIDALTNYYAESMDKDIQFQVKGQIMKPINIDEISLSSIYSNMLVNAIEAQKHIPEQRNKYVHVTLKEGEKFAQIIVRNPMEHEDIDNLDKIETTKLDKENHGFGLANIKKNVAEHNGSLIIEAQDYEFCIKATLPLIEEE